MIDLVLHALDCLPDLLFLCENRIARLRLAQGKLHFEMAQIGDDLVCTGAKFANTRGNALNAYNVEVTGSLFLGGAEVMGEVVLVGAQIGGDLVCDGAKIENAGGNALNAYNVEVTGSLFLGGVEVAGEVVLVGAQIGGHLVCDGANITSAGGKALNAADAKVTGTFFLRAGATIDGVLDLTAAELGPINDDPACWPETTGDLILDRCRYGAFTGHGISAAERIRWLALQDPARFERAFWPQPYEQCAKVFREMGHLADAEDILIEKEKLQRADRLKRIENRLLRATTRLADGFLAVTMRHGRKPLIALWWLLALWLLGTVVFFGVYRAEAFKPNNALILRSAEWYGCAQNAPPWKYLGSPKNTSQLDCFLEQPEARSFPEFNAGIYAFDVLVPLVQVEQQVHWIPDEDIWPAGGLAKGLVYFKIVAGWLLSLVAAAGLSGIIKSD